jgi:hypothetical protein
VSTEAERVLAAEQLVEARTLRETMTEFMARWAGQAVNNVLEVGTVIMPAGGLQSFSWQVSAGSIAIDNQGTHPMVVVAGGASGGGAPTSGIGVSIVPANSRRVVNVASRQVTVYGTPADVFCYEAFTKGATPVTI